MLLTDHTGKRKDQRSLYIFKTVSIQMLNKDVMPNSTARRRHRTDT
ncbi:MAG: hypothetical protein V7K92_30505 [Nostoc sp.]